MHRSAVRAKLVNETDGLAKMPPISLRQLVGPLLLEIFQEITEGAGQVAVGDYAGIELIKASGERLAEATTVQFRRFPVACKKTLLHLHVAFNCCLCKGSIDNG